MKIIKPEDLRTYVVKLTGFGKLELNQADYEKIKSVWADDDISGNTPLKIGKKDFKKHQIAGIEEIDRTLEMKDKEENNKAINKEIEEDRKMYLANVDLPPEEKAKKLWVFKLAYQATTGVEPEEKYNNVAIAEQTKFFKDNPHNSRPDPRIFKAICAQALLDKGLGKPKVNMVGKACLNMCFMAYGSDCSNARYYNRV
jgi:hypothetical protein